MLLIWNGTRFITIQDDHPAIVTLMIWTPRVASHKQSTKLKHLLYEEMIAYRKQTPRTLFFFVRSHQNSSFLISSRCYFSSTRSVTSTPTHQPTDLAARGRKRHSRLIPWPNPIIRQFFVNAHRLIGLRSTFGRLICPTKEKNRVVNVNIH